MKGNATFPLCLQCGGRLARQYFTRSVQERVARVAHIYPFLCEGCGHRFHALAWRQWRLEWDGQVLVVPDHDYQPYGGNAWLAERYKFLAILGLLGILTVVAAALLTRELSSYQSIITELRKGFGSDSAQQEAEP